MYSISFSTSLSVILSRSFNCMDDHIDSHQRLTRVSDSAFVVKPCSILVVVNFHVDLYCLLFFAHVAHATATRFAT